jgi:hypothetical protein
VPAFPFGAAEYIGDVNTDKYGRGHADLRLIVEEAFSSTLVGKDRVRKELNRVGTWFADPEGRRLLPGRGQGPDQPVDGDDEAGAQAFKPGEAEGRTDSVTSTTRKHQGRASRAGGGAWPIGRRCGAAPPARPDAGAGQPG